MTLALIDPDPQTVAKQTFLFAVSMGARVWSSAAKNRGGLTYDHLIVVVKLLAAYFHVNLRISTVLKRTFIVHS